MSGDAAGDDVDDLINFLADQRLQMKLVALDIIKGLTVSPDGIDKLKPKADKLLVFMLRLVPVPDPNPHSIKVSEDALVSLVNLSQDTVVASKMLTAKVIGRLMDYLREGSCPHHRLMVMLLSNLTVSDEGCKELLQLGQGRMEGLNMAVLLKKFVISGVNWVAGQEDAFEHVAAILTNVTRLPQARKMLLQVGRGVLQALVAQLACPSDMRKRGSAGAIKNCCIEAEKDDTLDSIISDETVLVRMLGPINGEEPKEKDDTVREAVAESLLALASTKTGREALWKVKAQDILKKGYEFEEHPSVCRAMELTAELFMFNGGGMFNAGGGEDASSEPEAKAEEAQAAVGGPVTDGKQEDV